MCKYSEFEIKYLINNYSYEIKAIIIKELNNRSWASIQKKAFKLGLKRIDRESKTKGNPEILLNESLETYYWLGFLFADGHFSKNSIQINLSSVDINHLNKFCNYIDYPEVNITEVSKTTYFQTRLQINNTKLIRKLKDKYNIKNNKTYIPCDISNISGNELFSFSVGFVDGDGSIQKSKISNSTSIRVKCHLNWFDNMNKILDCLVNGYDTTYKVSVNKENLANFVISDIRILKSIKTKILSFNLPALNRKWDLIDMTLKNKKEISEEYKNNCFKLFDDGYDVPYVCETLKYSKSIVYKHMANYLKSKNIYVSKERKNSEVKELLFSLYDIKMRNVDIHKKYNIPLATISRYRRKYTKE